MKCWKLDWRDHQQMLNKKIRQEEVIVVHYSSTIRHPCLKGVIFCNGIRHGNVSDVSSVKHEGKVGGNLQRDRQISSRDIEICFTRLHRGVTQNMEDPEQTIKELLKENPGLKSTLSPLEQEIAEKVVN